MFAVRRYGQLMLVLSLVFGALVAAAAAPPPSHATAPCRTFDPVDKTERLKFTALDGASGMVASRAMADDGVFWANNDRGASQPNAVFAIDADGNHLATIQFQLSSGDPTVPGDFVDIEDIAIGPGPDMDADYLYLGDIGNNTTTSRDEVAVYRFREPIFVPEQGPPQTIVVAEAEIEAQRFSYQWFKDPTKTHQRNAEAIFVDPEGGDLYIFEKGTHSLAEMFPGNPDTTPKYSHVYKIPRPKLFFGGHVRTAYIAGHIQHIYDGQGSGDGSKITGADISHDGRLIVVRNGEKSFYWYRARGQDIRNVFALDRAAPCLGPDGTKGESVAILADGSGFYGLRESADTSFMSPVFKAMLADFTLPECDGRAATSPDHVGTPGDDIITGTDGNDVIVAFGGDDVINAGKGRDIICAGSGNDVVDGGGGNDIIFGRAGRDRLFGWFGDDKIYGGIHGDFIKAGWGDDLAVGGEHPDTVFGNNGLDIVRGDKGDDEVRGGSSDDLVKGNVGDDRLFGGYGHDSCDGGGGTDEAAGCEIPSNVP